MHPKPIDVAYLTNPIITTDGFSGVSSGPTVLWKDVRRLAHYVDWGPLATCERDYFVFQTNLQAHSVWVETGFVGEPSSFRAELEQRFGPLIDNPRHQAGSLSNESDDLGYVLWPHHERGLPIFAIVKIRRFLFFSHSELIHARPSL